MNKCLEGPEQTQQVDHNIGDENDMYQMPVVQTV